MVLSLMLLVSATWAQDSSNLLTNGGFEEGLAGWEFGLEDGRALHLDRRGRQQWAFETGGHRGLRRERAR